jgi:hypothetical protein
VDNFDFAMGQRFLVRPFEEPKGIGDISEHQKVAMRNCCDILTARDSDMLFAPLMSVSEGGIDFAASRYKGNDVLNEFNGTRQSIRVDSPCAGGVPS